LYEAESRQRLIDAVPEGEEVIMAVDASNCIYFYFLNKKGYGVSYSDELFKPYKESTLLNRYWQQGARYIYTDDPSFLQQPQLKGLLQEVLLTEGRFKVLKLKEK